MLETSLGVLPTFERVLLATDFSPASDTAFNRAVIICRRSGAHLHIVHAFSFCEATPPESGGLLLQVQELCDQAKQQVGVLVERARLQGVSCTGVVCDGHAASTVLLYVNATGIDLVVLGTRGIHGFERLVFGSTAEAVLRKAPCPVLTVGPHADSPSCERAGVAPIVFATDFHRSTTQAIRFAASFSQQSQAALHCVHVLPRSFEGTEQSPIVPKILTEALQHMGRDTGTAIVPAVCAIEYSSEVSSAVVRYAEKVHAGMVVLGVRTASLVTAHVPAHIAYRIITEAPCPVLTMAFAEERHGMLTAACL